MTARFVLRWNRSCLPVLCVATLLKMDDFANMFDCFTHVYVPLSHTKSACSVEECCRWFDRYKIERDTYGAALCSNLEVFLPGLV